MSESVIVCQSIMSVLKPICGMAGPPSVAKCQVSGPGIIGGSSRMPTTLTLTAYDAEGTRIRDGGARVSVVVHKEAGAQPKEKDDASLAEGEANPSASASAPDPVSGNNNNKQIKLSNVIIRDGDDGTYVATYTAPDPGFYKIYVDLRQHQKQEHVQKNFQYSWVQNFQVKIYNVVTT